MRKKILYVDNRSQYFVFHRFPLVRAIRDAGAEIHVTTLVWRPEDIEAIASEGFVFHKLAQEQDNPSLLSSLILVPKLARLYRELAPDLVHHYTFKAIFVGSLALRLTNGMPAIMSTTGLGYTFTSSSVKALFLRGLSYALLPRVLNNSQQYIIFENPDDLMFFHDRFGLPKLQLHLIKGSGIDTKKYRPLPERDGDPVVVLATRMLWDKGVFEFVEAAKHLKELGVQAHFILIGDTDPDNPSAIPLAQLQAWQESGAIEWRGYCMDMLSVFSDAHIVCLPSYREGLPRVLIEAASCGRPVVTTDTAGCREVVRHGENGLLVPVKHSEALAEALLMLLGNKTLRQEMGIKGRLLVEKEFSIEKALEETSRIYRRLIDW